MSRYSTKSGAATDIPKVSNPNISLREKLFTTTLLYVTANTHNANDNNATNPIEKLPG